MVKAPDLKDEGSVWTAVESFATNTTDGRPVTVSDGERLRGGKDSLPARFPQWFVPDGTATADISAVKMRLFEQRQQATLERAERETPSMPTARQVRATRDFVNWLGYHIRKGDEYPDTHQTVVEHRGEFELVS